MVLPKQYLSPNALFSLNRVLQEILDELELSELGLALNENIWVVPTLFDKKSRTFHFACVDDDVWGYRQSDPKRLCEFVVRAMWLLTRMKHDRELKPSTDTALFPDTTDFDEAKNRFRDDYLDKIQVAEDIIKELAAYDDKEALESIGSRFRENHARDIAVQLKILNPTPGPNAECSGACCYGNSREECLGINKSAYDSFLDCLLSVYHGYRVDRYLLLSGIVYRGLEDYEDHVVPDRFEADPNPDDLRWLRGHFYAGDEKLDPPSWTVNGDYDQFEYKQGSVDARFDPHEQSFFLELTKLVYKQAVGTGPVLLLPIYDVWLGDLGYGGIWGCVVFTFDDADLRQKFVAKRLARFRAACEVLASELAMAAAASGANSRIEAPYDLLEHFAKTIVHLQDWERMIVLRPGDTSPRQTKAGLGGGDAPADATSSVTRFYCYQREWDGERMIHKWERCKSICATPNACTQGDRTGPRLLRWNSRTEGKGVWDVGLMPELGQDEKDMFSAFECEFQYPKSAFVPKECADDATHELFDYQVMQQQLALLRTLIPKVRARRSALRNAAVSIMARNMSHNIGSHVLAAVRNDSLIRDGDLDRLSEHLQRRMDFIAELATVEALSASDSLLFHDVLGHVTRVDGQVDADQARGLNAQTLLLRHITGVQQTHTNKPVEAVINIIRDADSAQEAKVSFNSGVMGWQALYIIIENIIRNIAKHGRKEGCCAQNPIEVSLKVLDTRDDLVEIRVWDKCGSGNQETAGGGSVVGYLAGVLKRPDFLDADNALNPNNWGMKEMYISAAFLRGIALADLEGRQASDEAPVIEACTMDERGKIPGEGSNEIEDYRNLGFRFWLPKSMVVAVFVDDAGEFVKALGQEGQGAKVSPLGAADVEKVLTQKGVQIFSVEAANAGSTRIAHRYGLWLSANGIKDERRAQLPLDLLEVGSAEDATKYQTPLAEGDAEQFIRCVKERVLRYRLSRHEAEKRGYQIWAGDSTNPLWGRCGGNLPDLKLGDFEKAVVFDWHGSGVAQESSWAIESCWAGDQLPPAEVIDKFKFYESYRNAFPQTGLFQTELGNSDTAASGILELELLCAALTPVLILDERFQRIARNGASGPYAGGAIPSPWTRLDAEFTMGKIWKRMQIFVPVEDGENGNCDLESPSLENLQNYLWSIAPTLGCGAYVVVHQTIFDKLGSKGRDLARSLSQLAAEKNWVNVVCSGRGVPWQVLEGYDGESYRPRFIALSALLQCLEHMPSKLHLIRLLEVTRAPNRKQG